MIGFDKVYNTVTNRIQRTRCLILHFSIEVVWGDETIEKLTDILYSYTDLQ